MMKAKSIGSAAAVLATMFLAGQASAFEGASVSAANCDYGGKIKSIEATDRLTVKFTLCTPDPAFAAKAAFTPFGVQPAEHIAATGGGGDILDHPIGTGPWKLEKWSTIRWRSMPMAIALRTSTLSNGAKVLVIAR